MGEDEPEVAITLGEREHLLTRRDGDRHLVDVGQLPRDIDAPDPLQNAVLRHGEHVDARGTSSQPEVRKRHAQRLTEDQLLQGRPTREAQHSSTVPADGA